MFSYLLQLTSITIDYERCRSLASCRATSTCWRRASESCSRRCLDAALASASAWCAASQDTCAKVLKVDLTCKYNYIIYIIIYVYIHVTR